ncbi:MAG: EamA family transporter [Gammaproteobacteria bacterium]|nr:EamA family transporter [Gammaproteobacteria bacterium]
MKNTLLYISTVLIWGTTWFAIEFQLGEVAVEVSLLYRFTIAAACMWAFCLWRKVPMKLSLKNHSFILMLAFFNFSFNYMVLYWSQEYLTSAMASIAFSTLLIMNIINTFIFFGKPIAGRVIAGAMCGIAGIMALFWFDLKDFDFQSASMVGLLLALGGTLLASFGNMISVRNGKNGVSVLQGNAWGMLYGSITLGIFALINGSEFTFSSAPSYWISLIYLAVFGTVIAFACYFILFNNIGAEKASYVIVLFPFIAVAISTVYESFIWHTSTVVGFVLVVVGNALVLTPVGFFRKRHSSKRAMP